MLKTNRLLKLGKPFSRGSFSRAFLSVDVDTGELYVEKVFSPHLPNFDTRIFTKSAYRKETINNLRKLFLNEIKIMRNLKHDCVVPFVAANLGEYPTIVMKYAGENLSHIAMSSTFSESDIAEFLLDISSAIEYLHKNNILHLDISPQNIFFDEENGKFLLGDFGLATKVRIDKNLESITSDIYNQSPSAPPEFIQEKKFSTGSDIWMFGYCLFFILTGGQYATSKQRLFELLTSINYDVDILLQGTPNFNNDFYKSILKQTLRRKPSERASISKLRQEITTFYKKFKYTPKCLFIDQYDGKKLLEYNLKGLLDKLDEFDDKNMVDFNFDDLREVTLYLQVLERCYPNYRFIHFYKLRSFIINHLLIQSVVPDTNLMENFNNTFKIIINVFSGIFVNFHLFKLFQEINSLTDLQKAKLQTFINPIANLINQYTNRDGFMIVAKLNSNKKSQDKSYSLINIINNVDYHSDLIAINIDSFSNFQYQNAVKIKDIFLKNNAYYISFEKAADLDSIFVIVPHFYMRPSIVCQHINEKTRCFGLFSIINGVLNNSYNFEMQFKLLRKSYMLSTGYEDKLVFKEDNNYIQYVQTVIDNNEPLFITCEPFAINEIV